MSNGAENIFKLDLTQASGSPVETPAKPLESSYSEATAVMQLDLPAEQSPAQQPQLAMPVSMQQPYFVSNIVQLEAPAASNAALRPLMLLGLMLVAATVYLFIDEDLQNSVISMISSDEWAETKVVEAPIRPKKAPKPIVDAAAGAPGNPYWNLPNTNATASIPPSRPWTKEEQQQWSAAMGHKFYYQRVRAIEQVRQTPLDGNEAILRTGLEQKKFWTRMAAVLALAERGVQLDVSDVEKAFGEARDDLVVNYLKRFQRPLEDYEQHLLLHAMKVVGSRARLSIVQTLEHKPDPIIDLYLTAATFDPSVEISAVATTALQRRSIPADIQTVYREAVMSASVITDSILAKKPEEAPSSDSIAKDAPEKKTLLVTTVEYLDEAETKAQPDEQNRIVEDEASEDDFGNLKVIQIK
jgi:hypothetical protein